MNKYILTSFALFITPSVLFAQTTTANLSLSANNTLVKGCPSSVNIILDSGGNNILAADTTIYTNPAEVTIDNFTIGSILPMQTFNSSVGGKLEYSGARFPLTGKYTGTGVFGTINFTPSLTANSVTFDFGSDFMTENIITDANIVNVIDSAIDRTYIVQDRFNTEVDGVGFCTPDTQGPTVTKIFPSNGADLDTNIRFSLADNRTGVDISTLSYSINGVNYSNTSPETTVTESNGVFLVETDPVDDFLEKQTIRVDVTICDNNITPSANCTDHGYNFTTFTPPPPEPVCGDGIPTYSIGEQCDDGNTNNGDGCSALCIWERPEVEIVPIEPSEPLVCPEPVIITDILECVEPVEEVALPEETTPEAEPAQTETVSLQLAINSQTKVITLGEQLRAEGIISRENATEEIDLPLHYQIMDDQGRVVLDEIEVIRMLDTYQFTKNFSIGQEAILGAYTLILEISNNDQISSVTDSFQIVDLFKKEVILNLQEKTEPEAPTRNSVLDIPLFSNAGKYFTTLFNIIVGLSLLVFILLIIITLLLKKHHEMKEALEKPKTKKKKTASNRPRRRPQK